MSVAFNCVAESAIMQWRIFDIPLWICTSTIEFHFFLIKLYFDFILYIVFYCIILMAVDRKSSKLWQANRECNYHLYIDLLLAGFSPLQLYCMRLSCLQPEIKAKTKNDIVYIILY